MEELKSLSKDGEQQLDIGKQRGLESKIYVNLGAN